MRSDRHAIAVRPSVLDRLLDDHPRNSEDRADEAHLDLRQFRQVVARDLEALLNTRRSDPHETAMDYNEASQTMLTFGVMDLNSLCLQDPDDRSLLRDDIRRAIERFEPRLKRVRVSLDTGGATDLVQPPVNGWLFRSGDPAALARTLTAIAQPQSEPARIEPTMLARFNATHVAEQWLHVYQRLRQSTTTAA